MTQDISTNEAHDEADEDFVKGRATDDDTALALLLSDAFDTPPVPKSLVRRLDAGFADQWGQSPKLVSSRIAGATELASGGFRWVRSWPLAAGLAASLMIAIVLGVSSGDNVWASMIEAVRQRGLVQLSDSEGVRWLDLSKSLSGQQTNQGTRWIDLRKRIVLTHAAASNTLQREPLAIAGTTASSDALLVAFLVGQPMSAQTVDRFRSIELIEQRSQHRSESGRDFVDLHVRFQNSNDEQFSFSLQLDPTSNLPLAVQVQDVESSQHAVLTYPTESAEDLQAAQFPDTLVRVDVGTKSSETPDAPESSDSIASSNVAVEPEADAVIANDRVAMKTDSPGASQSLVGTLPVGPANKWAPVAVVSASDAAVREQVDSILESLWEREQVRPVEMASDLEMLRRAYLDLAGRIPTVPEVQRFMKDEGPDRYERLVDQLLSSPDHASQFAAVWRSFLIPEGIDLDAFGGREAFEKWLSERFADGEPYDQIVRKLLLAEGRLSRSGPLLFYSALKLDANQLAARTSRAFLGMRLECAQCHDHPFEPWTQKDFWSYAAFFAQISRPMGELESASTVMQVRDVDRGDVMLPETDVVVEPKFLGQTLPPADGTEATNAEAPGTEVAGTEASDNVAETKREQGRRKRLAAWLTGPQNPYFARATVNRVWSHLMGRGIVDPVDDFGVNNPAVSPELLDALASQFIDSGFDLRKLVRSIALCKAYRLSSRSSEADETVDAVTKRLDLFAQMNVKTLTAEQLYDCIAVATLLGNEDSNTPTNDFTLTRFGNSQRALFLQQFSAPSMNRSEYQGGIPQSLMLMNGALVSGATGENTSGMIRSLQAPFFTDHQRIDVLFMATLSRPASADEQNRLSEFVSPGASPDEHAAGLADLLWALINSAEFTLNH